MRRPTSSHRRRHRPPPGGRRVDAIAQILDEGVADDPDHLVLYVEDDGDDVLLGLRPIEIGTHPFAELAGCTAPPEWSMVGLRVRGRARYLDGDRPAAAARTTFLVDRSGAEASLLRTDDGTVPLPGPASGTIPDLCRRMLKVPTAPPPSPSTGVLWLLAWFDRLIAGLSDPDRSPRLGRSWAQLAVLHPAVRAAPDHDLLSLDDPQRLVALARAHTGAWPWSRLREEPDALVLPDGHLPRDITTWMDDGFYARWALGAYPEPAALAADLTSLVPAPLRAPFLEALDGLLEPCGPG